VKATTAAWDIPCATGKVLNDAEIIVVALETSGSVIAGKENPASSKFDVGRILERASEEQSQWQL
jgi:hypothetical protein